MVNIHGYIYTPSHTYSGYTRDRVHLTGYYNLERRISMVRTLFDRFPISQKS